MTIFAHDKRFIRISGKVFIYLGDRRIHSAVHIQIIIIIISVPSFVEGTLIMGQTAAVKVFRPGQSVLYAAAVSALVSHGPHDHAGPVFVPVDHFHHSVQNSLVIFGIICQKLIPAAAALLYGAVFVIKLPRTVAFIVRFIDDKKAIFVTELIKHRRVRIVAGADTVKIKPADHCQILFHPWNIDDIAGLRVGIMPVHAMESDPLPVHKDHIVLNADFS